MNHAQDATRYLLFGMKSAQENFVVQDDDREILLMVAQDRLREGYQVMLESINRRNI